MVILSCPARLFHGTEDNEQGIPQAQLEWQPDAACQIEAG